MPVVIVRLCFPKCAMELTMTATVMDEGFGVGLPCQIGLGACVSEGVTACILDEEEGAQIWEPPACDGD